MVETPKKELAPSESSIPMMPISELEALTKFVAQVKEKLMTRGKDYILQGGKQYTARSGFAKLAQGFNLSDEILKEEEMFRDGDFFGYNYTVRVFNQYGRQAVGVGSCTVDEPNLKHHRDRPYHDVRSIAFTRAWNRAVSNFVGSADVSAEEMSIGPDFEAPKKVESSQSVPLPGGFQTPTWDFGEAVRSEGWGNVGNAVAAWIGDSGLSVDDFEIEAEDLRCLVRTRVHWGKSFGEVSRMLDAAGFKWRSKEKRWVLMKPEGVQ